MRGILVSCALLPCATVASQEPCDAYADLTVPFEVSDAAGNTNLQANVMYALGSGPTAQAPCAFLLPEPMNCLAWVGETNTSGSFAVLATADGWEPTTIYIDVAWDAATGAPITEWRNIVLTPTEGGT